MRLYEYPVDVMLSHLHSPFYSIWYNNRGMTSNVTAVAVPIAMTIFMTDIFRGMKHQQL